MSRNFFYNTNKRHSGILRGGNRKVNKKKATCQEILHATPLTGCHLSLMIQLGFFILCGYQDGLYCTTTVSDMSSPALMLSSTSFSAASSLSWSVAEPARSVIISMISPVILSASLAENTLSSAE